MKHKTFDWDKVHSSPQRLDLMKKYFDKLTSEDDWVKLVGSLPRKKTSNRSRRPHAVRKDYRNLKEKFGFFK